MAGKGKERYYDYEAIYTLLREHAGPRKLAPARRVACQLVIDAGLYRDMPESSMKSIYEWFEQQGWAEINPAGGFWCIK